MSLDLEPILKRDLQIIGSSWNQLLDLPRDITAHISSQVESQPPVPISVLSLRFDCAMTLASWAHMTWDERRLTTGLDLLATVPICRFLDRHSRFLADHCAARDAVEEIGWFANAIVEVVDQTQARKIQAGKCPDCTGTLIAYIREDRVSDLCCTLDPTHTWPQTRWRWLGDRISGESIRCEAAARRLAAAIGL